MVHMFLAGDRIHRLYRQYDGVHTTSTIRHKFPKVSSFPGVLLIHILNSWEFYTYPSGYSVWTPICIEVVSS